MSEDLFGWAANLDPLGAKAAGVPNIPATTTWPVYFCPECGCWMPANATCGHRSAFNSDTMVLRPGSIEFEAFHE